MVAFVIDYEGFMPPEPGRRIVDYSPSLERAIRARAELRKLTQKKETNTTTFDGRASDKNIIIVEQN